MQHTSNACCSHRYLTQQLLLLLQLGLGISDAVDGQPNTALGDDVGDAAPDLDVYHCLDPCKTKGGEDDDGSVRLSAHHQGHSWAVTFQTARQRQVRRGF